MSGYLNTSYLGGYQTEAEAVIDKEAAFIHLLGEGLFCIS